LDQVNDHDDDGNYEEEMDETAADVAEEAENPEHDQDNNYSPEHVFLSIELTAIAPQRRDSIKQKIDIQAESLKDLEPVSRIDRKLLMMPKATGQSSAINLRSPSFRYQITDQ
jgi:hypothetical protein